MTVLLVGAPSYFDIGLTTTYGFVLYDEATGLVSPGPLLPSGTISVGTPVFTDANTMFVDVVTEGCVGLSCTESHVLRCSLTACSNVATLPIVNPDSAVPLIVSPGYSSDNTLAVFDPDSNTLLVSRDGGSSFAKVTGLSDQLLTATFTADTSTGPELVVMTNPGTVPFSDDTVHRVTFTGTSYTISSNVVPTKATNGLTWTPDGHLWAYSSHFNGLECSRDLGMNWTAGSC